MQKRAVSIFAFVVFVILVSLYFDSEIVKGFSLIRSDSLDSFFNGLAFFSSEIIVFVFLTGLFLWRKRKLVLPLWATMGLAVVIGFLLKFSIQRPRPFQVGIVSVLPALEKASHAVWNFSFPSFQTMLVFCVLPILSKKLSKLKYYWIAFAVLVGLSRVYFGLHFMSDVIAGAAIGYLIGMIVLKLEEEYGFGEKVYRKIFRKN